MHLQSQTAGLTRNQANKPFRTKSIGPGEEGKEKKPHKVDQESMFQEWEESGEQAIIQAKRTV